MTTTKRSFTLERLQKLAVTIKGWFLGRIKNNLTTETDGYALDARQGKALNDGLGEITRILNVHVSSISELINLFTEALATRQFCVVGDTEASNMLYGKNSAAIGVGFKTNSGAYIIYHITDHDGEIFSGWINTSTFVVTYKKFATDDAVQSLGISVGNLTNKVKDKLDIGTNNTNIDEGEDLNNYSEPGTYIIASGSILQTLTNIPNGLYDYGNAKLIVNRNSGANNTNWWGHQILIRGFSVWVRLRNGTAFEGWRCLYNNSNLLGNADVVTWDIEPVANASAIKRSGSIIDMIYVRNIATSIANNTRIGTVTIDYRPERSKLVSVYDWDTGKPFNGCAQIFQNGEIKYYGDALTSKKVYFNLTWII